MAARIQLIATSRTREPGEVRSLALVAASMFDLTCAVTGGRRAGAQWLRRRADLAGDAHNRDRTLADQVRTLCQHGQPARTATLGRHGAAVMQAWEVRRRAIGRYRHALAVEDAGGVESAGSVVAPRDSVVASLLHLHHVRVLGPDPEREALCHRLARSAALAVLARDLAPEGA
ncbi:MAG: thiopeptide-type bacteriocin biosynthesis protein [Actinomycetes bacterium]